MRRTVSEKNKALAGTDAFIRRSRRLAKARWPKQMLTVDNWLELILAKYERTHGEKIELTPLQRKYPLIFAWGQFFKAIKRGKVH